MSHSAPASAGVHAVTLPRPRKSAVWRVPDSAIIAAPHAAWRLSGTTRRFLPEADLLSVYLLVRRAIETFQTDGVPRLYWADAVPSDRDSNCTKDWLTRRLFRFLHRHVTAQRLIDPTQSLAKHKESYGGERRRSYCAMNTRPALPRLVKPLRACGFV